MLLLLEGGGSVLLLEDSILAFFQGLGKLKQSGAVGHDKEYIYIGKLRKQWSENFGFNTKCNGGFGWRRNMVEIRDKKGR